MDFLGATHFLQHYFMTFSLAEVNFLLDDFKLSTGRL